METRRVEDYNEILNSENEIISYFKDNEFGWFYLWFPDVGFVNILNHDVVEDSNGIITVKQIIVDEQKNIRGYLKKGVWKNAKI